MRREHMGSLHCPIVSLCNTKSAGNVLLLQAILETELASTSSQNQHLQQQLEAVERNRTDLEASWLRNRRLNHAARIIQRRYRLWRSRNHVARFGRDAEVCS